VKNLRIVLVILVVIAAIGTLAYLNRGQLAGKMPYPVSAHTVTNIQLPPGFEMTVFADDVPNARSLALSPDGTLFVGTRTEGKIYAVLDSNRDFRADRVVTIVKDLKMPNGVAFRDGALYVAEIHRILKFPDIEKTLDNPPAPLVVTTNYPGDEHHGWKFIRFGPDGKLYVPVGAPCNICDPTNQIYSTITRIDVNSETPEIFARGVRNTVGFDWHPQTKELWFTDNGRDELGEEVPPDELNHAPREGMHFGFPYFHGKGIADPEFGAGKTPGDYELPALELGPHVAALGMRFYSGTMFPEQYRGGIFIAEHGSWNRKAPIGYRVMFVKMQDGRPISYDVFAEGWLKGPVAWGRPVDVLQMPDGSLLVSDDKAGKIYRITYQ
jgi:glucose/arabinose dehydrogenase